MTKNEAKQTLKELFNEYPDILKAFRNEDWYEIDRKLKYKFESNGRNFYNSIYNLDPTLLNEILMELKHIPELMFFKNEDIKSFEIPHNAVNIGDLAFGFCENLTSIIVPKGITSIGSGAFYHCTSLTSLIIPEEVTSISHNAFGNCTSLTSLVIPESVISIGDDTFSQCFNLNLRIPKRFKKHKKLGFKDCKSVEFY